MENFHKWCYNAVQGLGTACLWYEIARLFDIYLNARNLGIIVGMLFIGWSYSYKNDEKKE